MEYSVKAYYIKDLGEIRQVTAPVNSNNFLFVRGRLNLERQNAIKILKKLQKAGKIKSLSIPKNKKIQKQLNELVKTKRQIDYSIHKIRELFL